MSDKKVIGLVTGLNPRAALEMKTQLLAQASDDVELLLTEDVFKATEAEFAASDRKIFTLNEAQLLEEMGAELIVIPDFKTGNYVEEIQREITTPIVDMKNALLGQMAAMGEKAPTMGILDIGNAGMCATGACDMSSRMKMVFPTEEENAKLDLIREQIRGGDMVGPFEALAGICERLVASGAEMIVPNCTQFALLQTELTAKGLPVMNVFEQFAKAVLGASSKKLPKPFKLGMIGGLGPAATVDLYDKIVKATPAKNDQEHLKVVIEQNPQIDDRTAALLEGGPDPVLAMYNCAKRLQNDGCDCIIIPCNTAHAFLPKMRRHLTIPFIDMQQTMLDAIQAKFGDAARVGLLATTGTVRTGIYSQKAEKMGMVMLTPDEQYQKLVMSAIYGPKGAKAGFTTGQCYDELYAAAKHMVHDKGCNVLILGCTELPLIFHEQDDFDVDGVKVAVADPTATLARKCVEVALETFKERGVR